MLPLAAFLTSVDAPSTWSTLESGLESELLIPPSLWFLSHPLRPLESPRSRLRAGLPPWRMNLPSLRSAQRVPESTRRDLLRWCLRADSQCVCSSRAPQRGNIARVDRPAQFRRAVPLTSRRLGARSIRVIILNARKLLSGALFNDCGPDGRPVSFCRRDNHSCPLRCSNASALRLLDVVLFLRVAALL